MEASRLSGESGCGGMDCNAEDVARVRCITNSIQSLQEPVIGAWQEWELMSGNRSNAPITDISQNSQNGVPGEPRCRETATLGRRLVFTALQTQHNSGRSELLGARQLLQC